MMGSREMAPGMRAATAGGGSMSPYSARPLPMSMAPSAPIAAPHPEPGPVIGRQELLRRRREIAVVILGIQPVGQRELPKIGGARCLSRLLTPPRQYWEQESGQHGHHREHHEQLDERKGR